MNWLKKQIFITSSNSLKRIPYKKSTKLYSLLLGMGVTFYGLHYMINKQISEGKDPYKKAYFRKKFSVPPYERIMDDLRKRDYEIEPVFCDESSDEFHRKMEKLVLRVQHRFVLALSMIENAPFGKDSWERKDQSGGGIVRLIEDGTKIERGGVNVSISKGTLSEETQRFMIEKGGSIQNFLNTKKGEKIPFFSVSISSVIHPKNPHAPTVHFNYRYFEIGEKDAAGHFRPRHWWFGGGCDLTPAVLYEDDCRHFHSVYRRICENYETGLYAALKRDCDQYFFNPHRGEHRGIGGVFFDGLTGDREKVFAFIDEMANGVLEAYLPILIRRCETGYSEKEKLWQEIRRGRYAEFNLAIDRGTKFGRSRENANVEAIYVSLPLKARFEYKREPQNAAEERLMAVLKKPVDWLD